MTRQIHATITVEGEDARVAAYRERVNALLDAQSDARYLELHARGRLDYRIKGLGVPYPPFIAASNDFPDLVIQVSWDNPAGGESGRATIQAGRVAQQTADAVPARAASACEVRVERDGTLAFALASRRRRAGEWIGYVVTAMHHAFFRFARSGGHALLDASDGIEAEWAERWAIDSDRAEYRVLDPREPIETRLLEELDRVANDFAAEWIWFDETAPVETAVERQRYEAYGFAVSPANVRAGKIKTAMRQTEGGGFAFETADEEGREVVAIVARHWLAEARQ